nr:MAG TPA: hypothetical protein [Caudoviricetes sp.]
MQKYRGFFSYKKITAIVATLFIEKRKRVYLCPKNLI